MYVCIWLIVIPRLKLQPLMTVRSIDNPEKHPKKITNWINNLKQLHRKKPPPTVNYSKNMPDITKLTELWSQEFEEVLSTVSESVKREREERGESSIDFLLIFKYKLIILLLLITIINLKCMC